MNGVLAFNRKKLIPNPNLNVAMREGAKLDIHRRTRRAAVVADLGGKNPEPQRYFAC
jgi:hypothetical protein